MKYAEQKLGIRTPLEWVHVPTVKIRHLGGASLLVYYGVAKLLQIAYPEAGIDWAAEVEKKAPGAWRDSVRAGVRVWQMSSEFLLYRQDAELFAASAFQSVAEGMHAVFQLQAWGTKLF